MYRRQGQSLRARQSVWIEAYGAGASLNLLLATYVAVNGAGLLAVALGLLGIGMGAVALWVQGHPVPGVLKPAWLRQMEADGWAGYWGDDADRRAGQALVRSWAVFGGIVAAVLVTAMINTSHDALVWGSIAFGMASLCATVASSLKR
jgi:hypothetical protein